MRADDPQQRHASGRAESEVVAETGEDRQSNSLATPEAASPTWRLVDELAEGLLLLDVEGIVCACNEAARAFLSPEQAPAGRDFFEQLGSSAEVRELRDLYREGITDEEAQISLEVPLEGPGRDRQISIILRPLDPPSGRAHGLALLEDRTALQVERSRRVQAERLATVGELAASVVHELNNPLASIKTLAEFLARQSSDHAQRQLLEIIAREASRAARVVSRNLGLARPGEDEGLEPVHLNDLVKQVLEIHGYSLVSRETRIRLDLDPSISLVNADRSALIQVVLNLVMNAEQALEEIDSERLVILRTRESSDGVTLAVVDNGPGIPRDRIERLFEPFYTTKRNGSGLGLAIAQATIGEHGGKLWVESQPGRGSAFFVQLPRARTSPSSPDTPPDVGAHRSRTEDTTCEQLSVLVADDEPTIRLAVNHVLTDRGHQVFDAENADEAIRLATEESLDVVLVDARMPGGGLPLIHHLQAVHDLKCRVILMTGDLLGDCLAAARGQDLPCLTKPFDFDEMIDLVEELGRHDRNRADTDCAPAEIEKV